MTTVTTSRPATPAEMQAEIDRLTEAHARQYDEIERLRQVMVEAARILEIDGDEWGVAHLLRCGLEKKP